MYSLAKFNLIKKSTTDNHASLARLR